MKLLPERVPVNQRMVGFLNRTFFKLLGKLLVCLRISCVHNNSRSILVYAVNSVKSAKFLLGQKIQPWRLLVISVRRNKNARLFVENHYIIIAVNCSVAVVFCHKFILSEKARYVIPNSPLCHFELVSESPIKRAPETSSG